MFFENIRALNNNLIFGRQNPHYFAGFSDILAGYYFNCVAFVYAHINGLKCFWVLGLLFCIFSFTFCVFLFALIFAKICI